MFDEHGGRAEFAVIYIAEAHPVDEWQTDSNEAEGIRWMQHASFEDRLGAAARCAERLGLAIPTAVDGMDNAAGREFSAWPERIYILGTSGEIAYRGGPGPWDFDPGEAETELLELLSRAGP